MSTTRPLTRLGHVTFGAVTAAQAPGAAGPLRERERERAPLNLNPANPRPLNQNPKSVSVEAATLRAARDLEEAARLRYL